MNKLFYTACISLLLTACGSDVSGTYADKSGLVEYTFKSGKAIQTSLGMSTEYDYIVEDKKVKIKINEGTLVFPILEDGSLQGPMGVKLIKK